MTKRELEIRQRDAGWKAPRSGGPRGNASTAAEDRRTLLAVIDAMRAVQGRLTRAVGAQDPGIAAAVAGHLDTSEAWDPHDGARASEVA